MSQSTSAPITEYLQTVQRLTADPDGRLQALKKLLAHICPQAQIDYDRRRAEASGPALLVYRGGLPTGFIWTVQAGEDLTTLAARVPKTALPNILLTDFLTFKLVDGARSITLSTPRGPLEWDRSASSTTQWLYQFLETTPARVRSSLELAQRLGRLTALLREQLAASLTAADPDPAWREQWELWRAIFDPHLSPADFASASAQALTFGLVLARIRHTGAARQQLFHARDAVWNLPPTVPFLRGWFRQVGQSDSRTVWLVDALAALLAYTDIDAVRYEFSRRSRQEDPLAQLAVTFEGSYGASRPSPPTPLVNYLVSGAHLLLQRRFKRVLGLADEAVRIVNPGTGSGSLLFFVIQQIYETMRQQQQLGAWDDYVSEDLLARIVGDETALADYALTHLKIALQLDTAGYRFASNQRLRVTLAAPEPLPPLPDSPLAQLFQDEMQQHRQPLPDLPITVILQQPDPGQTAAACQRAQQMIDPIKGGICGLILDRAFLESQEQQTLRADLLRFYSDLYVLHLPQTTLLILVRRPRRHSGGRVRVRGMVLDGPPEANLAWLAEHHLNNTRWQDIHPQPPEFRFQRLLGLPDALADARPSRMLDQVMPVYEAGLVMDRLAFQPGDDRQPILYRPFDIRYTPAQPLSGGQRARLAGDNLTLCVRGSQVLCADLLVHADLLGAGTRLYPLYLYPGDAPLVGESPFAPGEGGRYPNLDSGFIVDLAGLLDMTFVSDGRGDLKATFGPEDVFHYLYALLNSPAFQELAASSAALRVPLPDSARQFRSLARRGRDLTRLHTLRRAENRPLITGFQGAGLNRIETGYPRYIELAGETGGRVYINKGKYFTGVERPLWNKRIGDVQVLREWLAAREDQILNWHDLRHYQLIVAALAASARQLDDIDELMGTE